MEKKNGKAQNKMAEIWRGQFMIAGDEEMEVKGKQ